MPCCWCRCLPCPTCHGTGLAPLSWAGCVDGQGHDYPAAWWGVVPPACRKCGQAAAAFQHVTWQNLAVGADNAPSATATSQTIGDACV